MAILCKNVLSEVFDEDTFLIGLNRPEKRNCVDHETALELYSAFEEFESRDDLKVAILYGKGGNFCSGYDLKSLSEQTNASALSQMDWTRFRPMGPSMMAFSKPVIAAIDGYAVAGGLELALMCDLRIVEDTAVLGVFCRRFGVPLIDGGTVRLPQLIGLSRALDLIITGREVSGKEAFDIGLAHRLCATGTVLGQAIQLSRNVRKYPQECLKADRRSAYYSTYDAKSYQDAFEYELTHGLPIVAQESIKGAHRFINENIGKHGSSNLEHPPKSKM